MTRPNISLRRSTRNKAEPKVAASGHVHHWYIDTDFAETGKCPECGAVKEFRVTFGVQRAVVACGQSGVSEVASDLKRRTAIVVRAVDGTLAQRTDDRT